MKPSNFWEELQKRRVVRVAIGYAVAAFVVLQVAELTLEPLTLPGWSYTLVLWLTIAGFPIAVVLAWAFDMTPDGIERAGSATSADESVPTDTRPVNGLASSARHAISTKKGLIGTVAIASIAMLLWATTRDDSAVISIAGLPFTDLSPAGDNEYLGDGIANAVMDGLSDAGVRVASAFSFRGREQDVRRIGSDLGVTHVMEGSLTLSGQRVRVSVRLVNASDGVRTWNEDFDDDFGEVLALQDRVVRSIVDQLRNEGRGLAP